MNGNGMHGFHGDHNGYYPIQDPLSGGAGLNENDEDMMDYVNFVEDPKNEYSSMLIPPSEQDAIMGFTHVKEEPEDTISYKEAQAQLASMKFGKIYDTNTDERKPYNLPEKLEDYSLLISGTSATDQYKYQLHVGGIPPKSRVETQIKCKLTIAPTPSNHENLLHLPADTIAKPKFQLYDQFKPSPNVLDLDVDVVLESNPQELISICPMCTKRERKRAFRKKNLDTNEELHWNEERPRRLVIFNCKEMVALSPTKSCDIGDGQTLQGKEVELPLRMACYSRHQRAKQGFRMVFSLRDCNGTVVGRTVSRPIYITDDHKESKAAAVAAAAAAAAAAATAAPSQKPEPPSPASLSYEDSELSDQSSLKRRRDEDWNGSVRMPSTTAVSRVSSSRSMHSMGGPPSARLDLPSPQSSDGLQMMQPLTPANNGNIVAASASPQQNGPQIQRIIPAQGSVRGGVEVTLLGTGFQPGLVTMFGDSKSMSTQCWSDSTIVTHLPPAASPGPVVVSFEGVGLSNPQIFTYIDDTDRQLIELALQVVGMKMNGKLEDARNIAMRIVQQDDNGRRGSDEPNSGNENNHENVIMRCIELIMVSNGKLPEWQLRNLEGQTMMHLAASLGYFKVINKLILQGARIDLHDVNGMTPLHFAAMQGHRQIVERLIDHGADPFHMTKSGCTSMDLAPSGLGDVLPMAMSREDYTRYWVARRNSSSGTLASLDHEPFGMTRTQFDVWESDQDSGYENEGFDFGDSEDLESEDDSVSVGSSSSELVTTMMGRRRSRRGRIDGDSNTSDSLANEGENNGSNRVSGSGGSSGGGPRRRTAAQNISKYITDLSTNARNNWDRRWDGVVNYIRAPRSQHDGGSDSDTTVSPRNNITRVWNYFMPSIHEDKAPPSYEEIFPEAGGSSSRGGHQQQQEQQQQHHQARVHNGEQEQQQLQSQPQVPQSPSEKQNFEQKYIEQWTTKQKQLRNDRMLFFFWLPVLLVLIVMFAVKKTGLFDFEPVLDKLEHWSTHFREFLLNYLIGKPSGQHSNSNAPTQKGLTVVTPIDESMVVAPAA